MHITINPQAPLPIYAQIVSQIRDLVLSGHLLSGTALPSVRHLAESLEVNSLTIQKAYKMLETEGMISIQKGVGAHVAEGLRQMAKADREDLVTKDIEALVSKAKSLNLSKTGLQKKIDQEWEK